MDDIFVSLQEAALLMDKSVQTVRRMVKRGELSAQRMKTPQGFQYVVRRDALPALQAEVSPEEVEPDPEEETAAMLSNSTSHPTSQSPEMPVEKPLNEVSTSQNEVLISQTHETPVEKLSQETFDIMNQLHHEKVMLIKILERMQEELDKERRRPRTLLAHIIDWLIGRR